MANQRWKSDGDKQYLPIDCTRVPHWAWKKAENELHETEATRKESLNTLKRMLREEKNLRANEDDEFLLRFLRARKLNCGLALKLIKLYYGHRAKYPDLYEDLPESSRPVAEKNFLNWLPYRTSPGCPIWAVMLGRWNPDQHTFLDIVKFSVMSSDMISQNTLTQICGTVSVVDLTGFSWRHVYNISISDIRCFVSGAQDCLPLRQKAVHIVNNPSIFSAVYFLIYPFLSHKIKKRIFFHGADLKSLHKHIPPPLLPAELGGELGPFNNTKCLEMVFRAAEAQPDNRTFGFIRR